MNRRLVLLALALSACQAAPATELAGYGEGQYVYVASLDGGRISELSVREGDVVSAGQVVARIDATRMAASAAGADAAASAARSRSASALAEAVRRAEADAVLAHANLKRSQDLFASGYVAQARLDIDRAAARAADAAVAQARAEQRAAGGDSRAAAAEARLARARVNDTAIAAPAAGSIERIYRRAGEVVAPGAPVLALLPPSAVKVRFFAPQAMLPQLKPGARVAITCDGCKTPKSGRVTFVAAEPQFTPPVIYSREERARLVFLVEATPDDPADIRPGLPVSVRPAP